MLVAAAATLPVTCRVQADAGPTTYEDEKLDDLLGRGGYAQHPRPEGLRIAFVRVVRDPVFVPGEPYPTFLNALHWQTTEDFVTDELLLVEGAPYRRALARESERNLRARGFFSFVRIVAVRARDPDQVGLLVHTRDRWSLRPEPDWQNSGSQLTLDLQLTERNLFGRAKQAALRFHLETFSWDLRERYVDRRLLGQNLELREEFRVIFNRDSGRTEGTAGELSVGRPFYTLADRVAYGVSVRYFVGVRRDEAGGRLARVLDGLGNDLALRPVYDDRSVRAETTASYRRGERYKQTFTVGAGVNARSVAPNAETMLAPDRRSDFDDHVLPVTRREVYPLLRYELFLPRFEVFEDLTTYGVSESVREGPHLAAAFTFPERAFGSSSSGFTAHGSGSHVWAGHQGLFETSLTGLARLEDGRVIDQRLIGLARGATPPWLFGRLVASLRWDARRNDSNKTFVSLGGDSGLRGFEGRDLAARGASLILGNVEVRSLPLDLASVQLGAVLFYDAGTVYSRLADAHLRHDVGLGLRLAFPQLEALVFRFDLALPLRERDDPLFTGGLGQSVKLVAGEG